MLVQTASLSGAILFIVGAASAMAWALTQSGFSHDLAASMAAVPGGAAGFLLISIVAFIVLGSVLEGIPAIVLFGPLLFPVAQAARRARGALCDGRYPGDGPRVVRAAVRPLLLRRLHHRQRVSRGRTEGGSGSIWALCLVGLLVITFVPWITLVPGSSDY